MNNLDELVPLVERALDQVQANGGKKNVSLIKAEIELASSVTWEPGIGVKFDFFVPVDISGKQERETGHTLSMSLTPKGGSIQMGEPDSDELAAGILELAGAMKGAADRSARFAVTEGNVTVNFGVATEGKLKIIAGAGRKSEGTHRMKLTFRPTT